MRPAVNSIRWYRSYVLVAAIGLVVIAAAGLLAGVKHQRYQETCRGCGSQQSIVEASYLGIRAAPQVVAIEPTFRARIAADLGVPCAHDYERRLCESRNGFIWVTPGDVARPRPRETVPGWYDKHATAIVEAVTAWNPTLPAEFRDKVLLHNDKEYLAMVVERMRACCPSEK